MPAPTRTSPIDTVNERDEAVGTIERGAVLAAGANFRTAHVFVLNRAHDLLLQRLGAARDRHPCRWGSSVAAYVHAGESYEEAAKRRLFEELGLSLPLDAVGKIRMRDECSLKFVSLFLGHDGTPAIREPDHIDELEYWSLAQLDSAIEEEPKLFTPTFRELYGAFGGRLH